MDNIQTFRVYNVLDRSLMGWLPVISIANKKLSIIYSTKVKKLDKKNRFQILEGKHVGERVTIDYKYITPRFFKEYVTDGMQINNNCIIYASKKNSTIYYYDSRGKLFELATQLKNINNGEYRISLPINMKNKKTTLNYINEQKSGSRFAQVWFPIENTIFEERYIHYGTISSGCATVHTGQTENWNRLVLFMLESRSNTNQNILGKLIIGD
jgi:hypothetical protein